jgi:hypothetical protein
MAPGPTGAPSDAPPQPGRRGNRWRHVLGMAALFVLALIVLGVEASTAPFEGDEADYTATSRYFGYWFQPGGLQREEWDGNHWTRTQPPLTRYIIGSWLMARGHDLESLNQPYVSTASSFEVNRRKGRVPTDDVLAAARQPMVLLGAGAVTLLYPLGVLLSGPLAGMVAVGLALSSPFLRYTLVHAWAEAPLACFMLLAAVLAALAVRRLVTREARLPGEPTGRHWLWWGGALGLALGLASATKLTGLVGAPLLAAGVALVLVWQRRALTAAQVRGLLAAAAWATVIMLLVIVAVNPFLWRGPVVGLSSMVAQRQREMAEQQEQWPEYAVLRVAERPWLTAVGVTRVGPWGEVVPVAVPTGLGLGLLGIIVSARRLRRQQAGDDPSSNGVHAPNGDGAAILMLLVWLAGYTAAIVAGLGLNYPRYFLPSMLLLIPFMGAGAAFVVERALRLWRGRAAIPVAAREPHQSSVQPPVQPQVPESA